MKIIFILTSSLNVLTNKFSALYKIKMTVLIIKFEIYFLIKKMHYKNQI